MKLQEIYEKIITVQLAYLVPQSTLESGIDIASWINLVSAKFDKKNKQSPWNVQTYVVKFKSFKSVIRL